MNQDYVTSCTYIGNPTSSKFYYGIDANGPTYEGETIIAFELWKTSDSVDGMRLYYPHGYHTAGDRDESYFTKSEKFVIGSGEKLTEVLIWGGYYGGNSGSSHGVVPQGLKVTTDRGRVFQFKADHATGDPYSVDVGSGILVGIFGYHRNHYDLNGLGFAMLRRVSKATLKNVQYPNIGAQLVTSEPSRIDSVTYDNSKGTHEQTYQVSFEETIVEREAWSITTSIEFAMGAEFTVEAGLLFASASSTFSFSLTIGVESTYARENERSITRSFNFPVTVAAGEQVTATATIYEGSISTDYSADVVYTLDTGKEYQYSVQGTYTGITTGLTVITTETTTMEV